jgi:hypothetical protein
MNSGEQLKTFKQGSNVIHFGFFAKLLWHMYKRGYCFPRQEVGESHPDKACKGYNHHDNYGHK